MNDPKPIFDDDEDDVEREIEANEERLVGTDDSESVVTMLDKALRPMTNVLGRDPVDNDQRENKRQQNNREQSTS